MDIQHISVSRKKCFDQCPQQYKFKYHLKVPSPGPEPFYFVYGKIIHKIAETYVEFRGAKSLGEVTQDVLRGKIPIEGDKLAPAIPTDYKRRMPGHLQSIQKITDIMGFEGQLERQFRYDLDPPHGKFITGFIDRLIIKEGPEGKSAYILDYKTTKKGPFRETKESIISEIQLRAYARVVNREEGIPAENIKCALYYLEGGDMVGAKYTQESLERAERELLNVYNNIANANPDNVRGITGQHCTRCDYKDMCPFFRGKPNKSDTWDGNMESLFNA